MWKQLAKTFVVLAVATCLGTAAARSGELNSTLSSTGDHSRSLWIAESQRSVGYRLYVPPGWSPSNHWPLVVIFPGGGQTENDAFDKEPSELKGVLARTADTYHYLLLALGSQGTRLGAVFAIPKGMQNIVRSIPPAANHQAEVAAARIIDHVILDLNVDRSRVFLMGNSMGEAVTMHFAQLYPGKWCAIAPSDGPFYDPLFPYSRLSYLKGARFVHGDSDTLASLEANRPIAEQLRAVGVEMEFVVVPGGTHQSSWYLALPGTFAFFSDRQCASKVGSAAEREP